MKKNLLRQPTTDVTVRDAQFSKWTPLIAAASTIKTEICHILLEQGGCDDNYGSSAVIKAAQGSSDSRLSVLTYLEDGGDKVDLDIREHHIHHFSSKNVECTRSNPQWSQSDKQCV